MNDGLVFSYPGNNTKTLETCATERSMLIRLLSNRVVCKIKAYFIYVELSHICNAKCDFGRKKVTEYSTPL